jgi:hypothetical protein
MKNSQIGKKQQARLYLIIASFGNFGSAFNKLSFADSIELARSVAYARAERVGERFAAY